MFVSLVGAQNKAGMVAVDSLRAKPCNNDLDHRHKSLKVKFNFDVWFLVLMR